MQAIGLLKIEPGPNNLHKTEGKILFRVGFFGLTKRIN